MVAGCEVTMVLIVVPLPVHSTCQEAAEIWSIQSRVMELGVEAESVSATTGGQEGRYSTVTSSM